MTATELLVREVVVVPPVAEPDFEAARQILPQRVEEERSRLDENSPAGTRGVMPTLFSEALRLKQVRELERHAAEVLVKLDIEPFSHESVRAYMTAKLVGRASRRPSFHGHCRQL